MVITDRIALWLRVLLRRARVENEMEKEMRLHLEMEIEHNLRGGLPPEEARRIALVAFGGVEAAKDAVRDEHGTQWLEQTVSDVRFALRGFRKHPLFALGVVVIIALGVGPNAAIFSIIHKLLIAPLPFHDGGRMVEFVVTSHRGNFSIGAKADQIDRWRASARTVEQIATFASRSFELGDPARNDIEPIAGTLLTPTTISFVGARPLIGRDVAANDTLSSAEPVALISYAFWQRKFGGRTDIVGQNIVVDDRRTTIIGVMPEDFSLPFRDAGDVFPAMRSARAPRSIDAVAKLKPGVSIEAANRELSAIFAHADSSSADAPRLERAVDQISDGTRRIVFLLFAAVTVVLLIACANVANLMLARAWERQREFAVRAAMGAGRARLIRQVMTESLSLSFGGAVVGIGVAAVTLKLLTLAGPNGPSPFEAVRLQPVILIWGLALTLVVAIAFGIAPALFAGSRTNDSLKAGARAASANRGSRRARSTLVVAEIALSAMLLVVCGLLVRTIVAAQRVDVGIEVHGLWGVRVDFDPHSMPDSMSRAAILDDVLRRVRAIPGVTSATLSVAMPPNFINGLGNLEIEGSPRSPNDTVGLYAVTIARPEYFAVTGTRLVAGRVFETNRAFSEGPSAREVVVNESFAKRAWPNGGAIGARFRVVGARDWSSIVGIARDVRIPMSRRRDGGIQVYQAAALAPQRTTIIIRSVASMQSLQPGIMKAVHDASARLRAQPSVSPEAIVADARAAQAYLLRIMGGFAAIALLLAAFGLHAVIAYSVGQRTREIGIRMALGARPAAVLELVLGQSGRLLVAGIAIGVGLGVLGARAVRAMLYQVGAADPPTIMVVSVVLAAVAFIASYAPARRAAAVDPVEALRAD